MSSEWVKEALRLQGRGEHETALRACAVLPAGERARFAAHTLRATSLAALGRRAQACAELQATATLAAAPVEWCRRAVQACQAVGELTLGRELIDRALDAGGPAAALALLPLRARLNGEQHLLRGTIEQAERVVALRPSDLGARLNLARLYGATHLHELAAAELSCALELEPANVEVGLEWAGVQLELGDCDAARRVLQRLAEQPLSTSSQLRRSWLLWRSGALDEAQHAAELALRAAPHHREARLQCARFALWRGELGSAREHLLGLTDGDAGLSMLRASLAFAEGNPYAALEHATRALAQDPQQLDAGAVAVAALLRLGRLDEAGARALDLKRGTADFRAGVALVEATLVCRAYGNVNHVVREAFELVAPVFDDARLDPALDTSAARLLPLLEDALDRLSGNFGPDATYLSGAARKPRRLDTHQPARLACVRAVDAIKARPLPWVVARVLALKARYPTSSLVHTHAAELHLWHGDYAACEAECRAALALSEVDDSRWAWVGLGAARMFQGHLQDALDVFAQSDLRMPPGGPLHAYRGEALRRMGEHEAADRELHLALQANASRVSAWINLALTAAARGDEQHARELWVRLSARLPGLVQDVESDLRSRDASVATPEPVAVLEAMLRAMRGNRSSGTITYFVADGLTRSAAAQPLYG